MNALDWLRAKTKQKPKYATGGYIAGPGTGDTPPVPIGCPCIVIYSRCRCK